MQLHFLSRWPPATGFVTQPIVGYLFNSKVVALCFVCRVCFSEFGVKELEVASQKSGETFYGSRLSFMVFGRRCSKTTSGCNVCLSGYFWPFINLHSIISQCGQYSNAFSNQEALRDESFNEDDVQQLSFF